jgi:hypothetical protein
VEKVVEKKFLMWKKRLRRIWMCGVSGSIFAARKSAELKKALFHRFRPGIDIGSSLKDGKRKAL